MVLRDPYAGHRDSYSGEPDGPLDEWTAWDFALAVATQAIKDGTTEEGHLRWEIDADDVQVLVEHDIDKAREAKEIVTSGKDYKPAPGEFLRTRLFHPYYDKSSGKEERWQTRSEWFEKLIAESGGSG
jgi:hypothetical protein